VDAFASRHRISVGAERWEGEFGIGVAAGLATACLKPKTFMNASGRSLGLALEDSPEMDPSRDLIVIYDDLDLAFGRLRLRPSGSGGGHRGVESIIDALGGSRFPRLRFGVGRPLSPEGNVIDFVLSPFSEVEALALNGHVELAVDALDVFLAEGIETAMERFNPGPSAEGAGRVSVEES